LTAITLKSSWKDIIHDLTFLAVPRLDDVSVFLGTVVFFPAKTFLGAAFLGALVDLPEEAFLAAAMVRAVPNDLPAAAAEVAVVRGAGAFFAVVDLEAVLALVLGFAAVAFEDLAA
jgi:hypothetical protein